MWGINGFYQHFWNPKWRTSLYGGYVEVDYDGTATNIINSHLPAPPVRRLRRAGRRRGAAAARDRGGVGNSCSPNFSWWQVGTRTQWNPHPDLDIGVDVLWTHLNTAFKGTGDARGERRASGAVAYALDDQDIVSVMFRIQRNFLP